MLHTVVMTVTIVNIRIPNNIYIVGISYYRRPIDALHLKKARRVARDEWNIS